MPRATNYVQCIMRREIAGGAVQTTSYIPQRFAKLGASLKLKDKNDVWIDGWVVQHVGDSILADEDVPNYRTAIRKHRRQTGDSDPRTGSTTN